MGAGRESLLPVERVISAGVIDSPRVTRELQGTIGEVRGGGRRSLAVPHAGVSRRPASVELWNRHTVVQSWTEGGGILKEDRAVVKDRLKTSGFYDGLSSKSSLLDLAVGAQTYLEAEYIPQGATVHAADLSQGMLEALKVSEERRGIHLHTKFRTMDATSLDYPASSFDRILSTFMMRYLSESEQRTALLEMVRATKDQGRIDIIDFDNVPNYNQANRQANLFTPARINEMIFGNPFFDQGLKELGAEVTIVMDEVPRKKQPFPARLHHLQLTINK